MIIQYPLLIEGTCAYPAPVNLGIVASLLLAANQPNSSFLWKPVYYVLTITPNQIKQGTVEILSRISVRLEQGRGQRMLGEQRSVPAIYLLHPLNTLLRVLLVFVNLNRGQCLYSWLKSGFFTLRRVHFISDTATSRVAQPAAQLPSLVT